jgi:cytochrome c551/c552
MKQKMNILALTSFLLTGLLIQQVTAQDGAALYKTCAACHTIGGGKTVGPDLKGITKRRTNDWLVQFIQSSGKLIKAGDPDAVAVFKQFNNIPMPDNALTVDQVNKILAHIDGSAGGAAIDPKQAALQHKVDSMLKANSPLDILAGKELFNGERRFENGGASCTSCHNATYNNSGKGGILAKDLTKAYSRLGGFAGIKGIIASAPFPSMLATYKNHPVTEIENAQIQLFLKNTDEQNPVQPVVEKSWFLYAAMVVGLFILLAITGLWFRRKRFSVSHAILKRQERYSK